ncbi:hypothetical protein T12_10560 [Trichinella patagoniensis]|uniref:Uncharacterized protein n=1 Tax=Trichinella patagoniensis TaxID=990121 RepID=A0A0V1ACE2_9BILA|nr:hypothetical protein T12_10560 [Trichinella patagoniensis]
MVPKYIIYFISKSFYGSIRKCLGLFLPLLFFWRTLFFTSLNDTVIEGFMRKCPLVLLLKGMRIIDIFERKAEEPQF